MKSNVGVLDKIVRLSIVLIVCALYLVDAISGLTAIIFGSLATYLAVTSFFSFCPIYALFHHNSIEPKTSKQGKK